MEKILGTSNRLLEINLSDQHVEELIISDQDRLEYLGGKGLGLKLLAERLEPGIDPLSEKNWIAFMTGVLLGTEAPCSARFSVISKSPLTGIMAHAPCGGPFGMAFKTAGYDGLLITGKASIPTVLVIDPDGVHFKNGTPYWGMNTREAQSKLIPNNFSGALVIGPAGENQVRYANIASGYRFANRGGLGAVMGAKNLKAIVASGGFFQIVPNDIKGFKDAKNTANFYIDTNSLTSKVYPKFGTASHVNWCNKNHIMPVKNFTAGYHEKAVNVSGEAISFAFKSYPQTCLSCRIKCGHATLPEDGIPCNIPDYDALVMLGPNLGIFDAKSIITWHELCGLWGIDPISTGGVFAWCMEAGKKDIIDTPLGFENPSGIIQMLEDIVYRRGLGDEMANGTRYLSLKYGGTEYAMHVKGLEIGAYDPRKAWGQGLGFAVANQGGCHQSSALYALEVGLNLLPGCSAGSKAFWVCFLENFFASAINSLQMCPLTAFAFLLESSFAQKMPQTALARMMEHFPSLSAKLINLDLYAQFFRTTMGCNFSQNDLIKAGERIHILERWLNTQEGIGRKDDTLPLRLTTEFHPGDSDQIKIPLEEMVQEYYAIRGYDQEGVPKPATLESVNLAEFCLLKSSGQMSGQKGAAVLKNPGGKGQKNSSKERSSTKARKNTAVKGGTFKGQCYLTTPTQSFRKSLWVKTLLWMLGKSIPAVYAVDHEVRREFNDLPDDFTFSIAATATGPFMIIGKAIKGKPQFLGMHPRQEQIDLTLQVKSPAILDDLVSLKNSGTHLFSGHQVIIRGDMEAACRIARILNISAVYLLPDYLARRVVRTYPDWGYKRKYLGRFIIGIRAFTGL